MNLNSHVALTLDVLESMNATWGKYFAVDDLASLVRDIHKVADVVAKDLAHHARAKNRERVFYHVMKARRIWLDIMDGREDPKDPKIVKDFFENLVLAMHLVQDAVICPRDIREHDFIEKKIWEILEKKKVLMDIDKMSLDECRQKLKLIGFNSDVSHTVDPEDACVEAAFWTAYIAKAVMSGRVIPHKEAETFLVKNGVIRVTEVKNEAIGKPIRDRIANKRMQLAGNINLGIKLALLHLFIVFICGLSYGYNHYYKGYHNPVLEAWLTPIELWVGIPVGLFILKPILLRRYDKKVRGELDRASLLDYYPTHAFFDAPDVYLEYMDGSGTPYFVKDQKEQKVYPKQNKS